MDNSLAKRGQVGGLFKELDPYVNPNGKAPSRSFRPAPVEYRPSSEMRQALRRADQIPSEQDDMSKLIEPPIVTVIRHLMNAQDRARTSRLPARLRHEIDAALRSAWAMRDFPKHKAKRK